MMLPELEGMVLEDLHSGSSVAHHKGDLQRLLLWTFLSGFVNNFLNNPMDLSRIVLYC